MEKIIPFDFYSKYQLELESESTQKSRVLLFLGFARLIVFFSFLLIAYFVKDSFFHLLIFSVILIPLFFFLVAKYVGVKLKLKRCAILIDLITKEKACFKGDFTGFSNGIEFKSDKHRFSNDLDFFVPNGIFSFLNRTASIRGQILLANSLLDGINNTHEMNRAIDFFSSHMKWCLEYRFIGELNKSDSKEKETLKFSKIDGLSIPAFYNWFSFLVPMLMLSGAVACYFNIFPLQIYVLGGIILSVPTLFIFKKINYFTSSLPKYENFVRVQLKRIRLLKEFKGKSVFIEEFTSPFNEGNQDAEKAFNELENIIKRMNARLNLIVAFFFNFLGAYDLRTLVLLSRWKSKYVSNIELWEQLLTQVEVFISGATVKFNYPNTIFATINDEEENIKVSGISHPLIQHKKNKANNFSLNGDQQFYILTGPNMAGKSTFLRSLGISIVFAQAGFPVFAEEYNAPTLRLLTSMRSSDDINSESSYFFSELSRLRFLVDEIELGVNGFVLLDEILKGTNSKDKQEGSELFLKKIKRLRAKGVIATHDLSMCALESRDVGFANYCFDSLIVNDELFFDYTLSKGICQNMNASFLLRKMNLVDI